MQQKSKFRMIKPSDADDEIIRLGKLDRLDRKLELVCRPVTMLVGDITWSMIDVIETPEGFGGRFAAVIPGESGDSRFLEVTKIYDVWNWFVFLNGITPIKSGSHENVEQALIHCGSA